VAVLDITPDFTHGLPSLITVFKFKQGGYSSDLDIKTMTDNWDIIYVGQQRHGPNIAIIPFQGRHDE
jgi:hypothetical protein